MFITCNHLFFSMKLKKKWMYFLHFILKQKKNVSTWLKVIASSIKSVKSGRISSLALLRENFFPLDLAAVWIWQMRCCVACREHGQHDVKTREFFCRFVDICFTGQKALCRIYWKCVTEYSILIYLHDVCKWKKTILWNQLMAHKAIQFLREKALFLQLGKVDFMTKSFH